MDMRTEIAEQFAPVWRVAFSFKVRAEVFDRDKFLSFSNVCRINQNEGSIRKVIVVSGFWKQNLRDCET